MPPHAAAQDQHRSRLHPSGGQGTVFGPAHFGVVFAFQQLIQRRRAARHQRRAEHRVKQQQPVQPARIRHIKAHERREQNQEGQPRLEQIRNHREPGFFNSRRDGQRLGGGFQILFGARSRRFARRKRREVGSLAAGAVARAGIKTRKEIMVNSAPLASVSAPVTTCAVAMSAALFDQMVTAPRIDLRQNQSDPRQRKFGERMFRAEIPPDGAGARKARGTGSPTRRSDGPFAKQFGRR